MASQYTIFGITANIDICSAQTHSVLMPQGLCKYLYNIYMCCAIAGRLSVCAAGPAARYLTESVCVCGKMYFI